MDLMKDYYVQHIASTAESTSDEMLERLNVLSRGLAVQVSKGGGKAMLTKLHESSVVNSWYLLVRVTQEGGGASVSPHATSENDRIVYSVDRELPIKVLIRNIGRDATVTERDDEEDDVDGDDVDFGKQQLVIKNPHDSSSPEKFLTQNGAEATLTLVCAGKREINCDINEMQFCPIQEIQTAVLRIVLRPK